MILQSLSETKFNKIDKIKNFVAEFENRQNK